MSEYRKQLQWLPIPVTIQFKLAMTTYKTSTIKLQNILTLKRNAYFGKSPELSHTYAVICPGYKVFQARYQQVSLENREGYEIC